MKILTLWAATYDEDDPNCYWLDSCWTEDKQEEAVKRAMEYRTKGFRSAVVTFTANHGNESMADEWDEDFQEIILPWNNEGD